MNFFLFFFKLYQEQCEFEQEPTTPAFARTRPPGPRLVSHSFVMSQKDEEWFPRLPNFSALLRGVHFHQCHLGDFFFSF